MPDPLAEATVRVVPWPDPVVEEHGHDPRSAYVERYWLGLLGPTATWLVRRLASLVDDVIVVFEMLLELIGVVFGFC